LKTDLRILPNTGPEMAPTNPASEPVASRKEQMQGKRPKNRETVEPVPPRPGKRDKDRGKLILDKLSRSGELQSAKNIWSIGD